MEENRKRNVQINFRVDKEEYDFIVEKAKISGRKNLTQYLRSMAIAGQVINIELDDIKILSANLACKYGRRQLENLIDSGYKIDLNQGMDARLVTDRIAEILSRIKWIKYIRFSCDTTAQIKAIENTAELLLKYGVKPYKLFIYLLVTSDVDNAAYRVEQLKQLKGITIYAQAERNEGKGIIPDKIQLEFAQRYIYSGKYRKETWQEYCKKRGITKNKQEVQAMGRIDFTAMKNSRKAIEDKVEDNIPTELEESYSGVWGGKEKITSIELSRLKPYMDKNGGQPYKINPKKVEQIAASAADIGIITPLRVRPKGEIYEVICGHHRFEAAKSLGQISVPCIVKDYSDEEVFKILTESNIQRDRTLPSEYGKIFSRYMELRNDDETTAEEIAAKFDVSKKTMYRYLAVNNLIPELREMTDTGIINIGAAENISKLDTDVQVALYQALDETKVKLSAALAKRVRSLADSQNGLVEISDIVAVLTDREDKKAAVNTYKNIRKKYNVTISDSELDELTARLLDDYFRSVSR